MDELTRRRQIEDQARSLLAKGRLLVLLTPHFLQQSHQRPALSWKGFPMLAAKLALLAEEDPEVDHMATVGEAKLVFLVQHLPREGDDPVLRAIFKTVMPKHYKHNAFKKAKTIRLGEVT